MNKRVEDIIAASKLHELVGKKSEDRYGKTVLWVLAIIGAIAGVAVIAYGVYAYFSADSFEDFEDEYDDFSDDFFEDEEVEE